MKGVDHGVAAAAPGLRRQLRDRPRRQRAQRRQKDQQPGPEGDAFQIGQERLAVGAQRVIAAQPLQQELLQTFESGEEAGAHQPGQQTHHGRVQQRPPRQAQIDRSRIAQDAGQELPIDHALHGLSPGDYGPLPARRLENRPILV